MSVTIQSQPAANTPVYNPQWWVATSTQIAQPNFTYYVTVADVLAGVSQTFLIPQDLSGRLRFDSGEFAAQFMLQINPYGLYGFQKNTGANRLIRVNIGEQYGVSPVYYPGSDMDYRVWNGALDLLDMQSYSLFDYKWDAAPGSSGIQFLTNNQNPNYQYAPPYGIFYSNDDNTFKDKSNYLYCLSSGNGEFQQIQIDGFDWSGNLIDSWVVYNPYTPGSLYTDKYVFIDIGYRGLQNMGGTGQIISGPASINVQDFAYYIIYDASPILPASTPPAEPYTYPIKKINVLCEPRYDVISCHYLAKKGQFETKHFAKISTRTSTVQRSEYSRLPYKIVDDMVTYDYGVAVDNILNVTEQSAITVASDYLTTQEIKALKEMVSSPLIYVDLGDGKPYVAMKMVTGSYEEKRKYNEPLTSVSFSLEYTHKNYRQRG